MAIVYAGVVPHAPLLVEAVAKEHAPLLATTRRTMTEMAAELYARQPDVIVIITPHGPIVTGTVTAHVAEQLVGRLIDFGDVATTVTAVGAGAVAHQLKTRAEEAGIPFSLQTFSDLDYGSTVPLVFLLDRLATTPVLPLAVGLSDPAEMIRYGETLYDAAQSDRRRWALFASGDFSRRAKAQPGLRRRPTAEERRIASALTAVDPTDLRLLTPDRQTCGYAPVITLLAAIQKLHPRGAIRSFEAPFGVGQLIAGFTLSP